MRRRSFIASALCTVATRATGADRLSHEPSTTAVQRLAAAILSEVTASERARLRQIACDSGWRPGDAAPADLKVRIAADFRSDATIQFKRVRLSMTESAWYLHCGSGA